MRRLVSSDALRLLFKCASNVIATSIFCCRRSWNTCSATINGWSRTWNLGSSRRRAGCPRSSAVRQRPVWPSLRRASASTQQSAPPKRGRESSRWEARKRLPRALIFLPFSLHFCCPSVFPAGGKAAEDREAASAAETWEPDERIDRPVWRQHQGAAAAPGERPLPSSRHPWRATLLPKWWHGHVCCVAEWKVSSVDGERDSEIEDVGWKTQPADERLERSPETPEEGRSGLTLRNVFRSRKLIVYRSNLVSPTKKIEGK